MTWPNLPTRWLLMMRFELRRHPMHEMCAFFVCWFLKNLITALTIVFTVQGNRLFQVLVYPVKRASLFNELLSTRNWEDHLDFSDSSSAHLQLNMSPNSRKRGGFKLAYFRTLWFISSHLCQAEFLHEECWATRWLFFYDRLTRHSIWQHQTSTRFTHGDYMS